AALALGYTTLLNHSYDPNVDYRHHVDEAFLDIVALRDIRAGEELTIDYEMDLWFDPGEPEPADLAARRADRARRRALACGWAAPDMAIAGHSAGSG
ncbi:MAG: SET domain-containing protein-lysine N-methyltransferase, partial [Azospirillaceae bacterium]